MYAQTRTQASTDTYPTYGGHLNLGQEKSALLECAHLKK